jgi:hypothetical protein
MATLTMTRQSVVLKVWFYGTLEFRREAILGIEMYRHIPIVGEGVRVHHSRPEYPEKVIFWWLAAPAEYLVKRIILLGYGGLGE